MLISIREGAARWILWAIVGVITLTFALWGVNSYFQNGGQLDVATVNGTDIGQQTYQNALNQQRESLSRVAGGRLPQDYFASNAFKQQVLQGLIQDTVTRLEVQNQGYRATDQQLRSNVRQTPAFQTDGKFNAKRYQQVLANAGYTLSTYEQAQRVQLAERQLYRGFVSSAFVSDATLDRTLRVVDQQRVASYAVILPASFRATVQVSDAAIKKEYDGHGGAYRLPARSKVDYLELSVEQLEKTVSVSDAELRKIYANDLARFRTPAQRQAGHILVAVPDGADAGTVDAARAKAEDLAKRARAGADFAKLAEENSDDTGSAAKGGDLGTIIPGTMAKPFEDALDKLKPTEVSEPVRTRFGFHVIKLISFRPAREQSFDTVRAEILQTEKKRLAGSQYVDDAETLRNTAFENPDSLQSAADAVGLQVQHSDWFTASQGDGVAASAAVRKAAFSDDVLNQSLNSEAIEVGGDKLVVLRKQTYEAARVPSLKEVRGKVVEILTARAASDAARALGEKIVKQMRTGADWNKLLADHQLQPHDLPSRRAQAGGDTAQISQVVFAAPVPSAGKPVYGTDRLSGSNYVVYRLTSVTDADPAKVDDAGKQRVHATIAGRWGQGAYLSYRAALRENARIKTFPDQL